MKPLWTTYSLIVFHSFPAFNSVIVFLHEVACVFKPHLRHILNGLCKSVGISMDYNRLQLYFGIAIDCNLVQIYCTGL